MSLQNFSTALLVLVLARSSTFLELWIMAHSLARKAFLQRSSSRCSLLCSKASRCNAKKALESISFPFGKLIAVHCLGCKWIKSKPSVRVFCCQKKKHWALGLWALIAPANLSNQLSSSFRNKYRQSCSCHIMKCIYKSIKIEQRKWTRLETYTYILYQIQYITIYWELQQRHYVQPDRPLYLHDIYSKISPHSWAGTSNRTGYYNKTGWTNLLWPRLGRRTIQMVPNPRLKKKKNLRW